jgi:uncharacterized protein YecE (DUF72 family)
VSRKGRIRVGISGWRYEPWRGIFYPPELAQDDELAFASRSHSSIEINGTFYSLQRPASFERWHDSTPAGFVFAVKGPRFITHMRRLLEPEKPLANFFASGLFNLGEKLGPFLWQLPPNFAFDPGRLDDFFACLPRDTNAALALARKREPRMAGRASLAVDANRRLRHAIEVRNDSFVDDLFLALLEKHRVALVVADTAGKWPHFEEVTADFMYVRLHGAEELYASGYTDEALEEWAVKLRAWSLAGDVFCYFDNDRKVHAPFDAMKLRALLEG